VIIGAPHGGWGGTNQGKAYLFDTNGAILATFTNPSAARSFGFSVAAVGDEHVLVGAPGTSHGDYGKAFLFNTNGALLSVFTNPTPDRVTHFGTSLASLGSNRVLVGSAPGAPLYVGAAFLFEVERHTSGLTFTNRAFVSALNESDTNTANNAAQATVTVQDNPRLIVNSEFGSPVPPVGTNTSSLGSVLTNLVNSPILSGDTQYVCVGWTMTGHSPESGTSNQFVMTVTNDASLTWLWETNFAPVVASLLINPDPSSCGITNSFYASGNYHPQPERSIAQFSWNFGDGSPVYTETTNSAPDGAFDGVATYVYPSLGVFTATVTVTDNNTYPLSSTATGTVEVVNSAPVCDAGGPYTVVAGGGVTLVGTNSYDPDASCGDSLVYFEWDVDADGDYDDASGANPTVGWNVLSNLSRNIGLSVFMRAVDAHATTCTTAALITVLDGADLVMTKSVSDHQPSSGDAVTYTLTVSNAGPDSATGVVVHDVLPTELAFRGAGTSAYHIASGDWIPAGGSLDAGASESMVVMGLVLSTDVVPTYIAMVTNTLAESSDVFGYSVSGVGSNHFIVGARDYNGTNGSGFKIGNAVIFDAAGVAVATLENPFPDAASFDVFGHSVAGVGTGLVAVGAPFGDISGGGASEGVVYVFALDGALVTSITNPVPSYPGFGHRVAGMGPDGVLVSAWDGGANGNAYRFDTAGGRLADYPMPIPGSGYASDVTALGTHLVAIGHHATAGGGDVHLFHPNGTLLITITNPSPDLDASDAFGYSVAGVGDGMVFVGAPSDDTVALDAGAAYLFDTNGALVTTILSPTPNSESFAWSVASAGTNRLLVGAYGFASYTGVAYLYDLQGNLLSVITNPAPGNGDSFGHSVSSMGSDRIVIGSYSQSSHPGKADVFSLADVDTTWRVVTNAAAATNSLPADGSPSNNTARAILTVVPRPVLTVVSAHGAAAPSVGSHTNLYGSVLTNSVTSPIVFGLTQFVNMGWVITGNSPASGTTNQFVMTITNHATLTWLWRTNYWLETEAGSNGFVTVGSDWFPRGSQVVVHASADLYYYFTGWSGDAAGSATTTVVTLSAPRFVHASFGPILVTNGVPQWWLALHNLPTTDGGAMSDTDTDGARAWEEYYAGTTPTNVASLFKLLKLTGLTPPGGRVIRWSSESNRIYDLQWSSNLPGGFSPLAGASNLPATPPDNTHTDVVHGADGRGFYRVDVRHAGP
jgi:uncharacterized repeat protein (TIGR01451 family)